MSEDLVNLQAQIAKLQEELKTAKADREKTALEMETLRKDLESKTTALSVAYDTNRRLIAQIPTQESSSSAGAPAVKDIKSMSSSERYAYLKDLAIKGYEKKV